MRRVLKCYVLMCPNNAFYFIHLSQDVVALCHIIVFNNEKYEMTFPRNQTAYAFDLSLSYYI